MNKFMLKVLLTAITLFSAVNAQVAVRVYSRHEGMHDQNISRPRIFIENTGTETIRDFHYYYYFTVENEKIPTVDRYSVPNCQLSLENLGNGNYRVKYAYSNVDFKPGDILPNAQGNVVGLRYIDWSAWDKTNDHSFDNSSGFQQNGKIPVFLADGTQIFGGGLSVPPIPPQVPQVAIASSLYAVFSAEYTDIRDRATVTGGMAGSRVYTEVGCDAVVNGNLLSGGDVFLRERANINGDVAAKQAITKQNNVIVSGTEKSLSEITFPTITPLQVSAGTRDAYIGPNGNGVINPGAYREVTINANASVTFKTGVYNIDRLIIEPDAKLTFESQVGKKTDIRVKSECRFGDRTKFLFAGDTIPLSISIYSEQTSQLRIGTDAVIYGQITAPNANVVVGSRTAVYGMIMGKRVTIEPQSVVCKPATLLDFWHSEWAYAPDFDPLTFEYNAIIPNDVGTLLLTPYMPHGTQVLVNGNRYNANDSSVSVNVAGASAQVIVEVGSSQSCGKTVYVINVQRSSNYQIFVNEKSPASSRNEDGTSWRRAYKCLQKAIDAAGKEGKEIWVAEGTYYPIHKTTADNPRTATFLVKPGIEIIGGFKGDETEKSPKGSPYNTILSGDLGKNDGTAWPVSDDKLADNAYHVVTMTGNGDVGELKLEMVTISGGVANGIGEHSTGGGILNMNCAPTLMYVIISKNMAISSGAGIMDNGGIKKLERCLIQKNITTSLGGAGLYTTNDKTHLQINASVFDGNVIQDAANQNGGAAMYVKGTSVNIVNSIFTRNDTKENGGAIYNDSGKIFIENSTFSSNIAKNGQSVWNRNGSATIINSILWNRNDKLEIGGDAFSVNYTCITRGYSGTNNINGNPLFVSPDLPEGNDGFYCTNDDGLLLLSNSPCINVGGDSNLDYDIRFMPRPQRTRVDLGAYEHYNYENDGVYLGVINTKGEFVEKKEFEVLPFILDHRDIPIFAKSKIGRVLRVKMPKNEYTRDRKSGYVLARWKNDNGQYIEQASDVKIFIVKVDEDRYNLYFHSASQNGQFKRVLFVLDYEYQNYENPHAYVIMANHAGTLKLTIPLNQ